MIIIIFLSFVALLVMLGIKIDSSENNKMSSSINEFGKFDVSRFWRVIVRSSNVVVDELKNIKLYS